MTSFLQKGLLGLTILVAAASAASTIERDVLVGCLKADAEFKKYFAVLCVIPEGVAKWSEAKKHCTGANYDDKDKIHHAEPKVLAKIPQLKNSVPKGRKIAYVLLYSYRTPCYENNYPDDIESCAGQIAKARVGDFHDVQNFYVYYNRIYNKDQLPMVSLWFETHKIPLVDDSKIAEQCRAP